MRRSSYQARHTFASLAYNVVMSTHHYAVIATMFLLAAPLAAQELRTPQYPPKTSRVLLTEAQIAHARSLAQTDRVAGAVRDHYVNAADFWLTKSDDQIRRLIPPASVPRAFNVGTAGCPVHGTKIYEHGTYPWILDPTKPYVVECPIGHETYPPNDFMANLENDFADADRDAKYFDDGWGWVGPPDDHKYWFVAYACQWHWYRKVLPDVHGLSRAYVLTGEDEYARICALMLRAIAEEYPKFDYAYQSRYGELQNHTYHGKILNLIWETKTLAYLAEAYDNIFPYLAAQPDSEPVRALIEANILEEGIDAVFAEKIRGNFGMHQRALAYAAAVRQHGPTERWLAGILETTGGPTWSEGYNYAMYNFMFRDGIAYETAPGYCYSWVNNAYSVAELMKAGGSRIFNEPKMRDMVRGPLQLIVLGATTPAVGDSGSVYGGLVMPGKSVYRAAYREYNDPLIDAYVAANSISTGFSDYDSMMQARSDRPPLPGEALPAARLLDGYGMAVFENDARDHAVSLYYGERGGHSHRDTLAFDLYLKLDGKVYHMLPDTGYPDFMNAYVPGIFSWSKNTIAHNAVMIDRRQQPGDGPGQVYGFAAGDGMKFIDVDSAGHVYPDAAQYRRAMVMVEDQRGTYVIDFFRVRGGHEHHYSLHAPPGDVTLEDGQWSAPAAGTLAGTDVKVGELHDNPTMNQPGYKGGFSGYHGSGFSHFINPRTLESGSAQVYGRHVKNEQAQVVIRVLPEDQKNDVIIAAEAQVSPVKNKELLRYILVQRQSSGGGVSGGANELSSTFIAVAEAFADQRSVLGAWRHDIVGGYVVDVERDGGRDVVFYRTVDGATVSYENITSDADAAVISFDDAGDVARVVIAGGTLVTVGGKRYEQQHPTLTGHVISVDPVGRKAVVAWNAAVDPASLVGRMPRFVDGPRMVRHPVAGARKVEGGIELTFDDALRIGRGRVKAATNQVIETDTAMTIFHDIYRGARLVNHAYAGYAPVDHVEAGKVHLAREINPDLLDAGNDFWIVSFGPAAEVKLESVTTWGNN
jgi:hypothetical protein